MRRWTEKFAEELRGRHYAGQLTIEEALEDDEYEHDELRAGAALREAAFRTALGAPMALQS